MKAINSRLFRILLLVMYCQYGKVPLQAQTGGQALVLKRIFTRESTQEYEMLKALKINPANAVYAYDAVVGYQSLSPLQQAFGRLSLTAAEIFAMDLKGDYDAAKLTSEIGRINEFRYRVNGILALLVMNEVSKTSRDGSVAALKTWATTLYRNMKIRTAESILNEYRKWKKDPCSYRGEGYKPDPDCATGGMAELFTSKKPPQSILTNTALKNLYNNDANLVTSLLTTGLYTVTTGLAAAVLTSAMTATGFSSGFMTSGGLYVALSGNIGALSANGGAAGLGMAGWASIAAAPIAATIMAIVVGTMEGFAAVETARVEPMLKMSLGKAMEERINLTNVLADANGRDMFFMAFIEASNKSFQVTPYRIQGEVRFFCQAGYISKFTLSYELNTDQTGLKPNYQRFEFNTKDLSAGNEQSFTIPANARNIGVRGFYLLDGWKDLFNNYLAVPAFYCYTSYGTFDQPKYKNECPEVSSLIGKENQLTLTHGGGYTAWFTLTYTLDNKEVKHENNNFTIANSNFYKIPERATNVHLVVRSASGLVWNPWFTFFDKTWPQPPNECVRIYGTSLEPKWNNECEFK